MLRKRLAVLVAALALGLAAPALGAAGVAKDGDDVRVSGTCTRGNEATLRVRVDDGRLRIELRIDAARRGSWSVILLHDRRIAHRGTVRSSSSGSVRVRKTVADWFGRDTVVARATGPRGASCRATATI